MTIGCKVWPPTFEGVSSAAAQVNAALGDQKYPSMGRSSKAADLCRMACLMHVPRIGTHQVRIMQYSATNSQAILDVARLLDQ